MRLWIHSRILHSFFRRHTGVTPNTLRLKILAEQVIYLLQTTDMSINQIAVLHVYKSVDFFADRCYNSEVVNCQLWRRIEVVITGLTRNQFAGNGTWVRIPPSPPENDRFRQESVVFN